MAGIAERRWTAGVLFSALLLGSVIGVRAEPRDADHWSSYGRDFTETHFTPLDDINAATVGQLGLSWYLDLDTGQRNDSQPLEADGTVFVTTGQSVVTAIDAVTGRLLWQFDPAAGVVSGIKLRSSWGARGLAYLDGRVFIGTTDGRLISLDARTGKRLWSVDTLDKTDDTSITGAPRAFNGKVVVGFSGGDRAGTRGAISCFDAKTGRRLWRFHTVPGDPARRFENDAMRRASRTWSGRFWETGGGGAVWNAITYDRELNRVYIGTGNANPWNVHVREPKGLDNLFTASVVALDADSGAYVWHYQENPADAWDYDATADIELATLEVAGHRRRVLMHASKNGFFYVIDRDTGKLVSADPFGKVTWAKRINLKTGRPEEEPVARYRDRPVIIWPGNMGMHNWQAMSFSPRDGLAFIPALNRAANFDATGIDPATWTPVKHTWTSALGDTESGVAESEFSSSLVAWDPVGKREIWRAPTTGSWGGGTMATAGGLVFQGQMDGTFVAYDARSGVSLWTYRAGSAVLGAPISYRVQGKQYISVLSGPPSESAAYGADAVQFGWSYRESPRRVLTFTLGGKRSLPAGKEPAIGGPSASATPVDHEKIEAGGSLFGEHCAICHGRDAVSGGAAPELRASAIVRSSSAFQSVVRGGGLTRRGMPAFGEFSDNQLESVRSYILARSAGLSLPGAQSKSP